MFYLDVAPLPPKITEVQFSPLRLAKMKKADIITHYVRVDVEKQMFTYIVGGKAQ